MPTTPFVPNEFAAEAELRGLWDGQRVENTLYFTTDAGFSVGDMFGLAIGLADWYEANITPLQTPAFSLNEIKITSLESETAPSVVYTTGMPLVGTNTGDTMPNNVSWAIKFNTAGRGRSSRGRNFICAIPRGDVDDNLLAVGYANAYKDAYAALITLTPALDPAWQWVVYSRREDNDWRAVGLVQNVVSVSYTDLIVDSQRRRLPGRGT